MEHQNNIKDIDAAIQSILSRITPVNDNVPQTSKHFFTDDLDTPSVVQGKNHYARPCENSIRIEGDHNIIIASSIIPLALFFLSLLTLISTLNG